MASIKARMQKGEKILGTWLHLGFPAAAEIFARVGLDCVMIDLEHGPASVDGAFAQMQALGGHACTPLVRVPGLSEIWTKRALDAGAEGIMIPALGGVKDAELAAALCRYAPKGRRGNAAAVVRAAGYGVDTASYLADFEKRLLVIGQIETVDGLNAVDKIAAVEGIDMLFVGPSDLSGSMGFLGQLDHPDVIAASDRVVAAAKAAGKLVGTIPTPKRSIKAQFKAGYDLVVAGGDVVFLRAGAESLLAEIKGG